MEQETPVVEPKTTVPSTEQTEVVPYATHRKLLSEKKKLQEQLEAIANEKQSEIEKQKAEQGRFKDLYEGLKQELDAEKQTKSNYLTELNSYKELLAKDIPEDIRDTFDIAGLTIKQIQVLSDKFKNPPNISSLGSETTKQEGIEFDITKMDLQQLNDFAMKNPQAYFEQMKNRRK